MIFVLSPAKALDYERPLPAVAVSEPAFVAEAAELIEVLRALSHQDVAALMSLSDKLAALNVARYADWQRHPAADQVRPAVFAFNGDVYEGLDALTLSAEGLSYVQAHVRILSGLYGLLRPLDQMQPYRLEMGTALANPRGKDLYAFWGMQITAALQDLLSADDGVLVNLASGEYFKSVKPARLAARVVTPVFQDWKAGQYKIISFHAKRARGLMTRYAALHQIRDVEGLKGFDLEGYAFAPDASSEDNWVFRRRQD